MICRKQKHKTHASKHIEKRILSFLLCAALCLSMFPVVMPEEAEAAEELPENLYMLRAVTGIKSGSCIDYFHIFYTDQNGKQHNQYLLLKEGAYSESRNLLWQVQTGASTYDKKVSAMSKYTNMQFQTKNQNNSSELLASNSTTDLLFQTEYPIENVTRLDIMIDAASGETSEWTCKSLTLYRIDKYYGYDMAGYYSNLPILSFEGETIASAVIEGTYTYESMANGKLYCLSAEKTTDGYKLDTTHYAENNAVSNRYFLKLDIADTSKASFAGLRQSATSYKTLKEMTNLSEQLVVALTYRTMKGTTETLYVPAISSMICYLLTECNMGEEHLFGFGQQGDSIFFPLLLPGIDESKGVNVKLFYGSDKAAKYCGLPEVSMRETASPYMTGLQIYKGTPEYVEMQGASAVVPEQFLKNPVWYYTASTVEGTGISSSSRGTDLRTLESVTNVVNPRLKPVFSGTRYYVVLTTDSVPNADTKEELFLSLSYTDINNAECTTDFISLKNSATDFYGDWPTEPDGGAYLVGTQSGQKLEFLVTINNVKKFTGMTIYMRSGYDDYQFSSIEIFDVKSVSERTVSYDVDHEMANRSITTNWLVKREVTYQNRLVKYDRATLIQRDYEKTIEFGAGATKVTVDNDVDWQQYRYAMTYEDTQQNMGYNNPRVNYQVAVQVCNDAESNLESGDSGSVNMFYFQLVFENNETSAYVLANQQIQAGRFRSGKLETFTISMNHDYGNVVAVHIIPDDTLNEGDSFDKLQLEYVEVSKQDSLSVNPMWHFDINGWIDIDYRDNAAKSSAKGLAGRTEGELSRSYPVSSSSYTVNLLAEIIVTPNETKTPYDGILYAVVNYENLKGETIETSFDVGKAMYYYQGRQNAINDNTKMELSNNNKLTAHQFAFQSGVKLDSSTMLREGETTRFLMALKEPVSVNSVTFYTQGNTASSRKIDFKLYKILEGTGMVTLDSSGSYYRDYGEPVLVAEGTNDGYELICLSGDDSGGVADHLIDMTDNKIEIASETYTWTSMLGREPASMDDKLNVYVHMKRLRQTGEAPDIKDGNATDISLYDMEMDIQYDLLDSTGRTVQGGGTQTITAMNKDRENQVFYMKGIDVSGITSLKQLRFHATKDTTDPDELDAAAAYNCKIVYVVVERMRAGVVIETLYGGGLDYINANNPYGSAIVTLSRKGIKNLNAKTSQTVYLQISEDSQPFTVTRKADGYSNMDIAVALQYHTTNMMSPGDSWNSKNVFLSDTLEEGESITVNPGDVLCYNFTQDCLDYINGVKIAATDGDMNVSVARVCVCTYNEDGSCSGCYGVSDKTGIPLSSVSRTVSVKENGAVPVTTTLSTATAEGPENTACRVPLFAKFVYEDSAGSERSFSVQDLRMYVREGGFKSGENAVITMLLPNFGKIHYLALELKDDDLKTIQSWKLEKVSFDAGGTEDTAITNRQNQVNTMIYENEVFNVNLSDFLLAATVTPDENNAINTYGETLELVISSEGTVRATPCGSNNCFAVGSFADVSVSAAKKYGSALKDCSECLTVTYSEDEKTMQSFVFKAPANTSDEIETYCITLTSLEVSTKTITINVQVEPAPKPIEEPVEEPAEDPTVEPSEEPIEEPVEEPVEEPTEDPTEKPVKDPTEEPAKEPAEEPTGEPTEDSETAEAQPELSEEEIPSPEPESE